MTTSTGVQLNEDPCPITDQLFGQLSRASPPEAVEIAKTLPEPQRAKIAMFCYNRRHLHALGLMIASTCDRNVLVDAGGRVGDTVFRQSRDPNKSLAAEMHPPGYRPPKPISLARSGVR